MKRNDKILWMILFTVQSIFCLMFFAFSYDGKMAAPANCSSYAETNESTKNNSNEVAASLTVDQIKILQSQLKSLREQNSQIFQTTQNFFRQYSLLLAGVLLLSIVLEALLLRRIIQQAR